MTPRTRIPIASLVVALAVGGLGLAAPPTAHAGTQDYKVNWLTIGGTRALNRWNPCQTITYRVNVALASSTAAGRTAALSDARTAMTRVGLATGVTFVFEGATTQIPKNVGTTPWWKRQTQSEVVVAWVNQASVTGRTNLLGAGAVATGGSVTKMWTAAGHWRAAIGRGYVVVDARKGGTYRPGFGSGVTRGAMLLHEMGHVMGLGHVRATTELMYPTLLRRATSAYGSGDRSGLHWLGRAGGCISVPTTIWPQI